MRKLTAIIAGTMLAMISVFAGFASAPEDWQIPVLLDNGEVIMQPCYVTVEGSCIALVDSEETAQKVVEKIEEEYKNKDTVNVAVQEETATQALKLNNGDKKPQILSEMEAVEQIVEQQAITVETTEIVKEEQEIDYETIEKTTDTLKVGEVQIQRKGEKGVKDIIKEVVKENGRTIQETVIEEKIIKEAVAEIQMVGSAGMQKPLDSLRVTSSFGPRWGRQHLGVDFGMEEGKDIYAAKEGTVLCTGYHGSYGNLVKLDHGNGVQTYYAHCSKILVKEGQEVQAGDVIAQVGSTGNSTGPHLHFEVRVDGEVTDPLEWLEGA